MLPRVFQPRGQVVERVAARDVVNEKRAGSAAVVRPGDRPERLLSGLESGKKRDSGLNPAHQVLSA